MKNINIDRLNNLVWAAVMDVLSNTNIARKELKKIFSSSITDLPGLKRKLKYIDNQLTMVESERQRIISIYSKGKISEIDLEKQLERIYKSKIEFQKNHDKLSEQLQIFSSQKSIYAWVVKSTDALHKIRLESSDEKKQYIIRRFVKRIYVNYIDEKYEHIIKIEFKYPLLDDGQKSKDFLIDGTDISTNSTLGNIFDVAEELEMSNNDSDFNANDKVPLVKHRHH